jgi:hypothetical protein
MKDYRDSRSHRPSAASLSIGVPLAAETPCNVHRPCGLPKPVDDSGSWRRSTLTRQERGGACAGPIGNMVEPNEHDEDIAGFGQHYCTPCRCVCRSSAMALGKEQHAWAPAGCARRDCEGRKRGRWPDIGAEHEPPSF